MSTPETQDEHVTWIGRDRPGLDRIIPESPTRPAPELATEPRAVEPCGLRRNVLSAVTVGSALVIGALLFGGLRDLSAPLPLPQQRDVSLISVVTPGLRAVA